MFSRVKLRLHSSECLCSTDTSTCDDRVGARSLFRVITAGRHPAGVVHVAPRARRIDQKQRQCTAVAARTLTLALTLAPILTLALPLL